MVAYDPPTSPENLVQVDLEDLTQQFQLAPEVWAWIEGEVLDEGGSVHSPDYQHL